MKVSIIANLIVQKLGDDDIEDVYKRNKGLYALHYTPILPQQT